MKTKLLIISILFFITGNVKSQNQFWAMTYSGGTGSGGTIIHANSNGTGLTVAHNFQSPAGYHPYGNLLLASDGNLYGTCYDGGSFASCTIFRFNTSTGVYTDVYDFDIIHGDFPRSGVIEAPNGKLYGASSSGGAGGSGVIYSYDLNTSTYTDEFDLTTSTGNYPIGNPILHSNGKLYGMTVYGGLNSYGVIYSYDISNNTYTDVYDFDNTNGAAPYGSLIQLINGKLYGMTSGGGINNSGVLFSFDPSTSVYSKLIDFSSAEGSHPQGSLMQASNGLLYGMTSEGGTDNKGVIFSYSITNNSFTNLYSLSTIDGSSPLGSLTQAGNILCGTTCLGGSFNSGVMFNFDITTNTYTKVIDFDGTNGANPNGGFIEVAPTAIPQNPSNNNSILLFPNPVSDQLNVIMHSNPQGNTTFNLQDVSGKVIYSSSKNMTGNNSTIICLNGINSGTYLLEIITGKEKTIKKVMKE